MGSVFYLHKRYNAQLLHSLRRLRDDAQKEGFLEETEQMLLMAADFSGLDGFEDGAERILREVVEDTKNLIFHKGAVSFNHLTTGDPLKLERPNVARVMVMSAAAEYAVEQWFSRYSHDPELAEREGAYSIMDLENLAAMLDRHTRRQLVHYDILD